MRVQVERGDQRDRVYYGLWEDRPVGGEIPPAVITVEEPRQDYRESGSTEQTIIRSMDKLGVNTFGWGYSGHSPIYAADVILLDALGWGDIPTPMTIDFANDFTEVFTAEWRIRRSTVLRWVRGWWAENEVGDPPPVVEEARFSRCL